MPSREDVDRAVELLHQSANYHYFFDQLTSPEWVDPLRERGFFAHPPTPIREGDYVRFPIWVESRYLARVAPEAPEKVASIVLDMPATENTRVHEDIAEAALRMPPGVAASLAPRIATFLDNPHHFLLPEKVRDLVIHLARGGELPVAIELARALLTPIWPEPRTYGDITLPSDPRPRFTHPEYGDVLADVLSATSAIDVSASYRLAAELLEESLSGGTAGDRSADYSHIWRPAIEADSRASRVSDLRSDLVDATRDLIERLESDPAVVDDLESRGWPIFQRLALHLVRLRSDLLRDQLRDRAFETARLREPDQYHEFVLLLREALTQVPEQDREALVDAVVLAFAVEATDDSDTQRRERYWLARTLAALSPSLPTRGTELLAGLTEELGLGEDALDAPEFLTSDSGGVWVGPTSPMTSEEILHTPDNELLRFLATWTAPDDWRAPSPEGLGRSLQAAATHAPERFSIIANNFVDLDPTYVRALVQGLRDAARARQDLEWGPVLDLGLWVLQQADPESADGRPRESDPGWSWTRRALADLLGEGLIVREGAIAVEHRGKVWALLSGLLDDPDPTPEHEIQYGGSNMDPATLSLNTVRGEALRSLVRYALWVRSQLDNPSADGATKMPEAFEALERHLDRERDPSLAVRSVYGQFFPWLHLVDADWAAARVPVIFPPEPEAKSWFDAAWDAYIVFTQPFDRMADVLRSVYATAIELLPSSSEERRSRHDPGHHLAEHISVFVVRGVWAIDDALVDRFFEVAPAELRGHVHEFLGRSLQSPDVPPDLVRRGTALWDARLAELTNAQAGESRELQAFVWWFDADVVDEDWRIRNLLEVLRRTGGRIDFPSHVLKELANLVERHPSEAVEAVRQIVRGADEGWEIIAGREHVAQVLAVGLKDGNTRDGAEALTHELGARGYPEFRSVLGEP